MGRRQVTLGRLMAAVAVLGIDCFLVIRDDSAGLILGLALNLGLLFLRFRRGRSRRFWAGFEVSGLAALLVYVVAWADPYAGPRRFADRVVEGIAMRLPPWLQPSFEEVVLDGWNPDITLPTLVLGLPMLGFATGCGLVWAVLGTKGRPEAIPRGDPAIAGTGSHASAGEESSMRFDPSRKVREVLRDPVA